MAFSLEGEDDRAFQAALSFVDECVLDDSEVEDAGAMRSTALLQREDALTAVSCGFTPTMGVETSFKAQGGYKMTSKASAKTRDLTDLNREKFKRRTELNERKKMLRKAGIYGDANWMSKDSRLEIEYLNERIEKLQLDLQVLQSRKSRQAAPVLLQEHPDAMESALEIRPSDNTIAI